MKTSPVTQTIACCFFLLSCTFLTAQNPAPGGVQGSDVWYAEADEQAIIANRHAFDLFLFEDSLSHNPDLLRETSTYFFVLKPAFMQSTGAVFMELGRVRIYDDRIEHGQSSTPLTFQDGLPRIVAITAPPVARYGRRQHQGNISIVDSSLFEMAEVVLYPKRLNRTDIHKVTSYLALKYSITITQNTEKKWRDYLKADSTFYWSTYFDHLFDQRVIGLGSSQDERFNQTQTATSTGSFVQIALDTPAAPGSMPNVPVAEDAFIVFSERRAHGNPGIPCPLDLNTDNPLALWKIKLHNWDSPAEHLIIRIEKPRGTVLDSLFLFDGNQRWHLPKTEVDSMLEYKVYFDMLNNNLHYFFVESASDSCPTTSINTVGSELIVENLTDSDDPWTLETQSLKTGLVVSEQVYQSRASRGLDEGQHLVTTRDNNGDIRSVDVVRILSAGNNPTDVPVQPDIRVFPNPSQAGRELTLSARMLPSTGPITLVLSDATGKELKREEMMYSEVLDYHFRVPVSGMYHITLYQDRMRYSLKVIATE